MADVVLTVQTLTKAGVAPSYTAIDATDDYYVPNNAGRTFLHFLNTGSIATITVDVQQTVEGNPITDPVISVPATTGDRMAGAWSELYEVPTGTHKGRIHFTNDVASGVTVACIRV